MNHACRHCGSVLTITFVSLGNAPLANGYRTREDPVDELRYPLDVWVCEQCLLVQLPEYASPAEIFSDYAYFSSYSRTWLAHAQAFAREAGQRLGLNDASFVIEVASNDGYLLRYFREQGVRVLGVEPAANVASAARSLGVPTEITFFGSAVSREIVQQHGRADLVVANNVLAHVPDVNDFVQGLAEVLTPGGRLTIEVPHLKNLIDDVQFDTIYHEHFSYFSFIALERILGAHGLAVVDVERLPTHGGSLRVHAAHRAAVQGNGNGGSAAVHRLREDEARAGYADMAVYRDFHSAASSLRSDIRGFLADARANGRRVAGYGAAAKASTLLHYCGIDRDQVEFVVDRNPHKQGRFMPGTGIPILPPEHVADARPDFLIVFPWNLKSEITDQMAMVREWGGQFVTFIPKVTVE